MTGKKASRDAHQAALAVVDDVYRAWARNDADAFVEPYADTASAILPGAYLAGKEAIRATMASLFHGELKGSKGLHEAKDVRLVGSDVAIVISNAATQLAGQPEPDAASWTLDTWVVARMGDTWRVHAFHSCPEHPA
jgi:uncharacterized protein (TIGR02246 family)